MGIFTPAWKTKNPNKQETAFKYVLRANQPKLCEIAELAPLPAVREKAIGRITDALFLIRLFEKEAAAKQRYVALVLSGDKPALTLINRVSDLDILLRLADSQIAAWQHIVELATTGNEKALALIHDERMSVSVLEHAGKETVERCSDSMNRLLDNISDPQRLVYLAENANDNVIRWRAIWRIEDPRLREKIVSSPSVPTGIRTSVVDLLTNPGFLKDTVYSKDFPMEIRKKAVTKLADEDLFAIACDENMPEELRIEAAIYAKDPSVNEAILMNRKLPETVRRRAVSGIRDEEVLAQFAMSDENHELRKAAVKHLRDRALLQKIRDSVSDLRIDACEKLNHQWEHIYDSRNNGDDVAVYECKYCGERMMMPYE